MVDKNPEFTQSGDTNPCLDLFTNTDEFQRMRRYEQIARCHAILLGAFELDESMPDEHTKKFVSISDGSTKYPFTHFRIKLKPKNRVDSSVSVAVLRYPTPGMPDNLEPRFHEDAVYVAWETNDGVEETFILDTDAFSCLDTELAFGRPNDKGGWPSIESRTRADEIKQFTLHALLEDFEPDLQTNAPEVSA